MKNKLLITSIIALELFAISSCEKAQPNTVVNTNLTYAESKAAVAVNINTYTGKYQAQYNKANEFAQALKNKDTNYFNSLSLMSWGKQYDFIENVDIINYNIQFSQITGNTVEFKITMDILNSTSKLFPTGEQSYLIGIDTTSSITNISYFKNEKDKKIFSYQAPTNEVMNLCYYSSLFYMFDFKNEKDLKNQTLVDQYTKSCSKAYHKTHQNNAAIPLSSLSCIPDINYAAIKESSVYNKITDRIYTNDPKSTYLWYSGEIASYDNNAKQYVVNINLYADALYMVPSKTIQFTVKVIDNENKITHVLIKNFSDNCPLFMCF